jgi:L-lactate dehydrogenase (cytochrome)/(S)-mandelate dehydrogenase
MGPKQANSIRDLKGAARRRLPRMIFDYIEGGAEDEGCIDRNLAAWAGLELVPRYLRGIAKTNQATTLFGREYASPFGIAPMGMTAITHRDADLLLAQAAHEANIPFILSGAGNSSIEKIAKLAPSAWYQLYIPRDPAIRRDLIRRTADAGLGTLVVTVDVPIYSKRERDIRNGWVRPYKPSFASRLEALRHPGWLIDYLRTGIPFLENWQAYAPAGAGAFDVTNFYAAQSFGVQTWDLLAEIREQWRGSLVLKGILHPGDAARAVEAGADGIIVSNHGGRQFDRAPTPVAMLPGVLAAVKGRIPVTIDSGVMRGSDIVAAMSMGAAFAFIGRAALYAVSAYGKAGVDRAIFILQQEITLTLTTIGCADVKDLGPDYLACTKGATIA